MKNQYRRLRVAAILVSFAAGLTLVSLGVMGSLSVQAADGDQEKKADIIVRFDGHDASIRPITFTGEISGFRALQLTGLDIEYTTEYGDPLVCSIEGVGCPATNCFCDPDRSWGYWYWDSGDWATYMVGASSSSITQTGAIEGWQWAKWADMMKPPPQAEMQAALAGLTWLKSRQVITDGSYSGQVVPSLDVMLAIGANHLEAGEWRREKASPSVMDFVAVAGIDYSERGVAEAGKLATSVVAAEGCWPPGAIKPMNYYSPTLGSMSDQAGFLSWAILGTLAISDSVPMDSVTYLQGLAVPEGGWEWSPGWGVDTNSTAIAIQALVAGGVPVSATEIVSGLAYLKSAQNNDGGFPYQPDSPFSTDSDSNSTAWIVQGLLAAGEDPRSAAWTESGFTPIDFLLSTQLTDGSFEYLKGKGSDEFATRQVVQALLGSTLPMRMLAPAACSLEAGLKIDKYADSGFVPAGKDITYTLAITSSGPNGAQDVLITDTLPMSVSFNGSVSMPAGVTQPVADAPVWQASALYPGTHFVVYTATVDASVSGWITNSVELTSTTPLAGQDKLQASYAISVTEAVGSIQGSVQDGKGNGIEGATVMLSDGIQASVLDATAFITDTLTRSDGSYRFDDIPVGDYALSVTLPGEKTPSTSQSVTVGTNVTTEVDPISVSRKTYLPSVNSQ